MKSKIKKIFIFSLISFIFQLSVYANESIYNISISPTEKTNSIKFDISTGWGTRYVPPKWATGTEIWMGSSYGITDNLFVKGSGGYNLSSGAGGFKLDTGYKVYDKNLLQVTIVGSLLRETTGIYATDFNIIVSKTINNINLISNNLFEKAFAENRDGVDWNLTFGASYSLNIFNIGLEYIGEDIEDMWEDEEAEGGANNLFGMLLSVEMDKYGFSLTPGYSIGPRPETKNSFIILSKFWVTL